MAAIEGTVHRLQAASPGKQPSVLRVTTSAAFSQGTADRQAWEAWFSGLSGDGPSRKTDSTSDESFRVPTEPVNPSLGRVRHSPQ